jgi:hypothetical protein
MATSLPTEAKAAFTSPVPPTTEEWRKLEQVEVDATRTLETHLEEHSPELLSWLLGPRLSGTQFRLGQLFGMMVLTAWWFASWRHPGWFFLTELVYLFAAIVAFFDPIASRRQKIASAVIAVLLLASPVCAIAWLETTGRRW